VRNALQLQRESFVDLALLCGTDFSQRIKNVGPARALKLIRKFNSIENLLEDPKLMARLPDSDYLEDIAQARLVFASSPPMPEDDVLKQSEADTSEVERLLEKYGLAHAARLELSSIEFPMGADFEETSSLAFQETGFWSTLENLKSFSGAFGRPLDIPIDTKDPLS
jgi:flap endonuclease-1